MITRQLILVLLAILPACNWVSEAHAAVTFLGPSPYFSAADSPFPVDASNPSFFLEDFEDGELNTPGIFQPYPEIARGIVLTPSELTDSVDADDGFFDGLGRDGNSFAAGLTTVLFTDPRVRRRYFRLAFLPTADISYPNAFGFVWTDGAPNSFALLDVYGTDGTLLASNMYSGLGDMSHSGLTHEDRFLGVTTTGSIGQVEITSIFIGDDVTFELDHLQYGVLVPEQNSLLLVIQAIGTATLTLVKSRVRTKRDGFTHSCLRRK